VLRQSNKCVAGDKVSVVQRLVATRARDDGGRRVSRSCSRRVEVAVNIREEAVDVGALQDVAHCKYLKKHQEFDKQKIK